MSVNQLAYRLREVMLTGKWIANTNFQDQLSDVNFQQAIQKIDTFNTIAALTFHINYYVGGVLNVLQGGELEIKDKFSFDCPELSSEKDWQDLIIELLTNSEKLANEIEKLEDTSLDRPFVDKKYGDYRRNLNGIIEHCYYHLGQIVLLKKMIN